MQTRSNTRRIRVEFGDCDPAQIAYYPNYVRWIDQSTHHLFESVGLAFLDLQGRLGMQAPVVDLSVKYLGPAVWGDELVVESRIARWGSKSFDVAHSFTHVETGRVLVEARETRVCVRLDPAAPKNLASHVIPDEVRRAFEPEA